MVNRSTSFFFCQRAHNVVMTLFGAIAMSQYRTDIGTKSRRHVPGGVLLSCATYKPSKVGFTLKKVP